MAVIDVYHGYFAAACVWNGVERRAASVKLTATSDSGTIAYAVSVSFFPYRTPEDFAVSYDAYREKTLYEAKGRRSRKKEERFLTDLRAEIDGLAKEAGGEIFWDRPLLPERRG